VIFRIFTAALGFGLMTVDTVGQSIDFSRYLTAETAPFLELSKYPQITFKWNMRGDLQVLLNEGINSLEEGHPQVAAANFKEFLTKDSTFWATSFYLGVADLQQSNWLAAKKNFQRVVQLNPQLAQGYLELGIVSLILKDKKNGVRYLQQASSLNPSLVEVYYYQALIALSESEQRKALRLFEKCTEIDPHFAPARILLALYNFKVGNNISEDIALFDKAISSDSTYAPSWFWRGWAWLKLENPAAALSDWNKMLMFKPDNVFLLTMRGFLLIELKDYDKAFRDIQKSLTTVSPEPFDFAGGYTLFDERIEFKYGANYLIRKGYGLEPDAFRELKKGFCQLVSGRYENALQSFESAERIQLSETTQYLRGMALNELDEYDSAVICFSSALKADNDNFGAHLQRGHILENWSQYPQAKIDFDAMFKLQPSRTTIIENVRLNLYAKYYDDASIYVNRLIQMDSSDFSALFLRAQVRNGLGKSAAAMADLRKFPETEWNTPVLKLMMETSIQMGDTISAIRFFRLMQGERKPVDYLSAATVFSTWKQWGEVAKELKAYRAFSGGKDFYSDVNENAAIFLEGQVNFYAGQMQIAIEKFDIGLATNPRHQQGRYLRCKAYIALGKPKRAVSDLKKLKSAGYLDAANLYDSIAGK
jgi:tetratricopeptide (TPR) repeat protein